MKSRNCVSHELSAAMLTLTLTQLPAGRGVKRADGNSHSSCVIVLLRERLLSANTEAVKGLPHPEDSEWLWDPSQGKRVRGGLYRTV